MITVEHLARDGVKHVWDIGLVWDDAEQKYVLTVESHADVIHAFLDREHIWELFDMAQVPPF